MSFTRGELAREPLDMGEIEKCGRQLIPLGGSPRRPAVYSPLDQLPASGQFTAEHRKVAARNEQGGLLRRVCRRSFCQWQRGVASAARLREFSELLHLPN